MPNNWPTVIILHQNNNVSVQFHFKWSIINSSKPFNFHKIASSIFLNWTKINRDNQYKVLQQIMCEKIVKHTVAKITAEA